MADGVADCTYNLRCSLLARVCTSNVICNLEKVSMLLSLVPTPPCLHTQHVKLRDFISMYGLPAQKLEREDVSDLVYQLLPGATSAQVGGGSAALQMRKRTS